MSYSLAHPLPRVTTTEVGDNRVRLVIDGVAMGPVVTRRAARVLHRWMTEGGLDGLEGAEGGSKIARTLSSVDRAIDDVTDLLRNGLK